MMKNKKQMLVVVIIVIAGIISFTFTNDNFFKSINNFSLLLSIVTSIVTLLLIDSIDKMRNQFEKEKNNQMLMNIDNSQLKDDSVLFKKAQENFFNGVNLFHKDLITPTDEGTKLMQESSSKMIEIMSKYKVHIETLSKNSDLGEVSVEEMIDLFSSIENTYFNTAGSLSIRIRDNQEPIIMLRKQLSKVVSIIG